MRRMPSALRPSSATSGGPSTGTVAERSPRRIRSSACPMASIGCRIHRSTRRDAIAVTKMATIGADRTRSTRRRAARSRPRSARSRRSPRSRSSCANLERKSSNNSLPEATADPGGTPVDALRATMEGSADSASQRAPSEETDARSPSSIRSPLTSTRSDASSAATERCALSNGSRNAGSPVRTNPR